MQATLESFIQEPLRRCCRCKEEKPLSEFGKYSRSPDGIRKECKKCHSKDTRKHYASNKEAISIYHKEYRAKHKEKIAKRKKKYYEDHKEEILKKERENYQNNKASHQRWFKNYYSNNREKLIKYQKRYRVLFSEKKALSDKQYRIQNKEHISKNHKEYVERNKEKLRKYSKEYYIQNRQSIISKYAKYLKTPNGKSHLKRMKAKRRKLGFKPINKYFEGAEYHHFRWGDNGKRNDDIGIYIPMELHRSIWHNGNTGQGMKEINKAALLWLCEQPII